MTIQKVVKCRKGAIYPRDGPYFVSRKVWDDWLPDVLGDSVAWNFLQLSVERHAM